MTTYDWLTLAAIAGLCVLATHTAPAEEIYSQNPIAIENPVETDLEHRVPPVSRDGDRWNPRDGRLDRLGDRIDRRLERRGNRINARLDRRADRARKRGHPHLADRLDQRGDRIGRRLDERGNRIHRRFDRWSDRRSGRRADRQPPRPSRRPDAPEPS